MSIIAVRNVPKRWPLSEVVKKLVKQIKGNFEAINFDYPRGELYKVAYLRLGKNLNPQAIVQKIGRVPIGKHGHLSAFVPNELPQLVIGKGRKIPKNLARANHINEERPDMVFIQTHTEILRELQTKYTGLFNLSCNSNHRLMDKISQLLFERLKLIYQNNSDAIKNGFTFSKAYRKVHPHFADFQFILTNLHQIEDEMGKQRTQVLESELMAVTTSPFVIDNIPYTKVQQVCQKYCNRITKKLEEHIESLKCDNNAKTDTEEDTAQKKVRVELKKMSPYLGLILKQVISRELTPEHKQIHHMRIYGEPFLPPKDVMFEFLKKHKATRIIRSDRMFNCLWLNIHQAQYANIMTMDGSVIGDAKLVIRPSDIALYAVREALIAEMKALCSEGPASTEAGEEYAMEYEAADDVGDVDGNWQSLETY